jgi:thymidylate synthase
MIVTAWNPAVLPDTSVSFDDNVANGKQALPPCHYTFQCFARPRTVEEMTKHAVALHGQEVIKDISENQHKGADFWKETDVPMYELSLMLNQRSCDIGLGVPFNIVQYSILLRMLCEVANMVPGDFIWNGGDVHIYENHIEQLEVQLTHDPLPSPTFEFARKITDIDDFKYEDFRIVNYTSHPVLKMDVAV